MTKQIEPLPKRKKMRMVDAARLVLKPSLEALEKIKPIEPLKFEDYEFDDFYYTAKGKRVRYKMLNTKHAIRALFAKVNEIISYLKEKEE